MTILTREGAMDCVHENTANKMIEKNVLGDSFKCETLICADCGAYLRDKSYDAYYMAWLENLYKNDRNKFQIQCHFSSRLIQCAEQFLVDYPSVSLTFFFKALVVVFLDHIDVDEKRAARLNHLMGIEILTSFSEDKDKKRVNIQFKPKMLIEISAMAKMISLKPAQIVESGVVKMMTTLTSQDERLKAFWESEIMRYVDSMLKAA